MLASLIPSVRAAIALTLVATATALVPAAAQQSPQATFRSTVNMLALDVQVVDGNGNPLLGLLADDFTVAINGHARRVTSAELIRFDSPHALALPTAAMIASINTPGRIAADSRVFVVAVDDASFATGALRPALMATERFMRNLRPTDMVGVYRFPYERPSVDITHDHDLAIKSLAGLIGRREDRIDFFELRPSEIIDITAGDSSVIQRVVQRECQAANGQVVDTLCPNLVKSQASMAAAYYETDAAQRLFGLGMLIQELGQLPGHKNVVLISGGLLATSRVGGRPDVRAMMSRLGEQAARANVTTYVLHVDDAFTESLSISRPSSHRAADQSISMMADRDAYATGLEHLAGETGGVYLPVRAGNGDLALGRVLRETTAYYLLGVEPNTEDWNGRKLMVNVRTRAKGATVRALKEVIAR